MSLPTQDYTTLMRNQVASIHAKSSSLINFVVGSVLRAIVETNTAVVLWLQSLILQVLSKSRAATSVGADLDTFVADYGVTRLPAVAATGNVTFSRFTSTQQAVVPVGAQVQTATGTPVFSVIQDTTVSTWNTTLNGYVAAVGVSSITVPVQAVVAGISGNVSIAALSTLASSISGIDTVTNAIAYSNGIDAETDAALRTRFIAFLGSLSKGTKLAIGSAVTGVQSGIVYALVENQNYDGSTNNGYFYVVFDDGSGNPPTPLINTVSNAVDAARPVGTRFGVFGPTPTTVNVVGTIITAAGYTHATLTAAAQSAVTTYINSLALGQTLYYTRLAQVIYDSSPGVVGLTGLQLNSATADITATAKVVLRSGTVTIS